jgi:hypothetical protein
VNNDSRREPHINEAGPEKRRALAVLCECGRVAATYNTNAYPPLDARRGFTVRESPSSTGGPAVSAWTLEHKACGRSYELGAETLWKAALQVGLPLLRYETLPPLSALRAAGVRASVLDTR